jgi:hypothetical protein
MVSINDFAIRPAHALTREDTFSTGKYRFRFLPTPHVPHGWDAGVLFEETGRTLFCSDLFHQWGEREPITRESIIERSRDALVETQPARSRTTFPTRIIRNGCWKAWLVGNRAL